MPSIEDNYSQNYLNEIQQYTFARADKAGDQDGKVSVKEALNDLNIASLLSGQTQKKAAKLKSLTDKFPDALAKYAGENGTFTLKEFMQMKQDPQYQEIVNKYNIAPWFKFGV